jgi:hypothetical protein
MRAKSSKPTDLIRWNVYRLRKSPAEFIATVRAADAATAIARVVEEKEITDPEKQKRLFARRT